MAVGLTACAVLVVAARGDTIVLKNGIVYRGAVDRDKPLLWVYDGLKRIALRDSKVAKIESDASLRNLEVFRIEQPLTVHGGAMPKEVVSVTAGPWNDRGRRSFEYVGARLNKTIRMEQAINEMGPFLVKIRGVDGYWSSQLATSRVPRPIVLGLLAKVDRQDKEERTRVARFLIQAGWYAEARAELDRLLKNFHDDPDLRERVSLALASLGQLEAVQIKADVDRLQSSRQPREAAAILKGFPSKDVALDLDAQVRERQRFEDARRAADRALADELSALHARLFPEPVPKKDGEKRDTKLEKESKAAPSPRAPVLWEAERNEVLKALRDAPDAVRDRLVAWQKTKADVEKPTDARQFALAMSGYVLGTDAAVDDLDAARVLWTMRDQIRDYLRSSDAAERADLLAKLEAAGPPGEAKPSLAIKKLDTATRLAARMPPPLHEEGARTTATAPRVLRVPDTGEDAKTEYVVRLPPEYHPLRSYPTVVALHDGNGPASAVAWWAAEAAKRGYIIIAPEYRLTGQGKEYQYTESEHAAVELALRDAKRRFAVDSDRVFLGGQLTGGNMAFDFGLAHPDLFAGVVVIGGMPFKYPMRYLQHNGKDLPLYVVLGDLAPAANEVIFSEILKPLILKAWDLTYVEYFRRGLEDFPEEAPHAFDWMDHREPRDPYPKSFTVDTARPSDNRFFGVVIRDFQTGRTTAPEAVDGFGKNLKPATVKLETSRLSNLLKVTTTGVRRLEVWVSPTLIDFTKKMEVRINGRSQKGAPKPELAPLLEDLRLRGDRRQTYWMKVSG